MIEQFPKIRSLITLVLLSVAWLSSLAGFAYLTQYQFTPGKTGNIPIYRPANVPVGQTEAPYSLLLFLHPECPCSMATLTELQKLMAHTGSKMYVHIIFWQPLNHNDRFLDTKLVNAAKELPQVKITNDEGGALAKQFGVKTSGTALLYHSNGRLLFNGGITESRAHEGDNEGAATIYQIVKNCIANDVKSSPVFGCSL